MNREELLQEANIFRSAIEKAKSAGEFDTHSFKVERMSKFPVDCCDDAADLFTHYLYHEFGIDSIRVDGEYFDHRLNRVCGHSWQETDGWLIDLTGDQFKHDPEVSIKADPVYVGEMDEFHRQFKIWREVHSCGIECLDPACWDRMYGLYDAIMRHMD